MPKSISKDKIDEYYWAYVQLRVKQSFFNFFLLTINNYIGYFKNLDEDGDMSPNKKDKKCNAYFMASNLLLLIYYLFL